MAEVWTIRRVVEWTEKDLAARGIGSARLDADVLLAHVLGTTRMALYLDRDRPLSADELARYRKLIARRRKREPVAYITGEREFYGLAMAVDRRVLVPRPDTETLVERSLQLLAAAAPEGAPRVLDLGTGSGAIAIAIARPDARVDAVDVSAGALEVARANALEHGVSDRVRFLGGDLFAPLDPDATYDLVVSNPPYVTEQELPALAADVRDWEPHLALTHGAGDEGIDVHRRIALAAPPHVVSGGAIALEVGVGQAGRVTELLASAGFVEIGVTRDLARVERVVSARRA